LKICHLSTQQGFRGGERQLTYIHEGLLNAHEDSIVVYRSSNPVISLLKNVIPLKLDGIHALVAPFIIYRLLKKKNPDVIHCHDSRAHSLVAIVKPFLKIPVIVSRKTVYPLKKSSATSRKFNMVDHLIAVSQAAAEVVQRQFPNLPVTIIHDGVELSKGMARAEVRKLFGVTESITILGSVGYFSTEKNVPLLCAVADKLEQSSINAKIVLVGPVSPKFQHLVENHPSIICMGKIDRAEELYSGFDCYLSASTREGLGSALLDAVIRDIPAIALDSGGSRDIFESDSLDHCRSEEQFIDRVIWFCSSPRESERIKDRGFDARKRFSLDLLTQKHLELYQQIICDFTQKLSQKSKGAQ